MRFDVITIFPEMFRGPFDEGLVGRARDAGIVEICIHPLRDFTEDRHRSVDDEPYGGGPGMIMKPEPIFRAVAALRQAGQPCRRVVLMSPQGRLFHQDMAREFAAESQIVLICGRYEGVDERVATLLATDEVSVGDYILAGGELPAMIVIEAVTRLLPGAVGDERSIQEDTLADGLLKGPVYTRPRVFQNVPVPEVLLSGHHEAIRIWRRRESLRRTLNRRPDLLKNARLSEEDEKILEEIRREMV